jgi:hypothetical protein
VERRVDSPLSAPTSTYDPDLDPPRRRPGVGRPPLLPQEYQRLVANPFLAMFGLIVWFYGVRQAFMIESGYLFLVAILSLLGVVCLLQYHCLDCGATGLLFRWKSHACPRVRARQQNGEVRHLRGPNPVFQTVLWIYGLLALALLVATALADLP